MKPATNNYLKVTAIGVHRIFFFNDLDAQSRMEALHAADAHCIDVNSDKTADQLARSRARVSVFARYVGLPSGIEVVGESRWLS